MPLPGGQPPLTKYTAATTATAPRTSRSFFTVFSPFVFEGEVPACEVHRDPPRVGVEFPRSVTPAGRMKPQVFQPDAVPGLDLDRKDGVHRRHLRQGDPDRPGSIEGDLHV